MQKGNFSEHKTKYSSIIKLDVARCIWKCWIDEKQNTCYADAIYKSMIRVFLKTTLLFGYYDQSMSHYICYFYHDFIEVSSKLFEKLENEIAAMLYVFLCSIEPLFDRTGHAGNKKITEILKNLLSLEVCSSKKSLASKLTLADTEMPGLEFFCTTESEKRGRINASHLDIIESLGLYFLPIKKSIALFGLLVKYHEDPILIGACAIAAYFMYHKELIFNQPTVYDTFLLFKSKFKLKSEERINEKNGPEEMQDFLDQILLLKDYNEYVVFDYSQQQVQIIKDQQKASFFRSIFK